MRAPPTSDALARPALLLGLLLLLSSCSAYHRAVQTGAKALEEGRYEEAVAAYESALSLDARGEDARRGVVQARRGLGVLLVNEGQVAFKAGDLDTAATRFARAAQVDPDNLEAPQRYAEVLTAHVTLGDEALARNALPKAEAHFRAVLKLEARHPQARLGLERVQAAWARYHFAQGESFERKGQLGNALVEYLRADEERAGVTQARERAAEVRRLLREELSLWVVIPPVEDRAEAQDVAQRLQAGRIAAVLPKLLPIRVVTEPPPDGRNGVILDLALERVWTVKDMQVTQKSQTYLAGTRSVPNPERGQAEAALLSMQRDDEDREAQVNRQLRRLMEAGGEVNASLRTLDVCRERARGECESAVAACIAKETAAGSDGKAAAEACRGTCGDPCQAQARALEQVRSDSEAARSRLQSAQAGLEDSRRKVQRARDALLRIPATVEEPMHAEHVYDVENHVLSLHALVTTRVTELARQEIPPSPVTREAVARSRDSAHRGYERYGILLDPLVLRSEVELRNELGENAVAEVAKAVMERYEKHRQQWVDTAKRGQVRAGAEDVVEATVRALLLTADAPDEKLMRGLTLGRKLKDPRMILGEPKV